VTYMWFLAVHVGCVLIVLAAVVLKWKRLKPIAVISGSVALWMPLMAHLTTLGVPSPYLPATEVRVITSDLDETRNILYLFVDLLGKDYTPRVYQIPFDPSKFGGLVGDPAYLVDQVLQFQAGIGGTYEAVYIDYVPPDLLKDNMMRGWQAPREDD